MGALFAFLFETLKFLLPIILQVTPLILKYIVARDKTAKDRAREIQKEIHTEAVLMKEGNEDEISRRNAVRISMLEQLFRERSLRRKGVPAK